MTELALQISLIVGPMAVAVIATTFVGICLGKIKV